MTTNSVASQSDTLQFVIALAKQAGQRILDFRPSEVEFRKKGPDAWSDFVSDADLASEAIIRQALIERFPNDEILAEESVGAIDYAKPIWMVDPLDGTKEFKFGGDRWAVMIGRCHNGRPDLGVGYAAAIDTLYFAERGRGAWRVVNGGQPEPLRVSDIDDLREARLITRKPATPEDVRPKTDPFIAALPVREWLPDASIVLKCGRIAANEADGFINTNRKGSKWDTCAPQAVLEEAGGLMTDIDGQPLDYTQESLNWERSYVGSNGVLHEQLIERCRSLEF